MLGVNQYSNTRNARIAVHLSVGCSGNHCHGNHCHWAADILGEEGNIASTQLFP